MYEYFKHDNILLFAVGAPTYGGSSSSYPRGGATGPPRMYAVRGGGNSPPKAMNSGAGGGSVPWPSRIPPTAAAAAVAAAAAAIGRPIYGGGGGGTRGFSGGRGTM